MDFFPDKTLRDLEENALIFVFQKDKMLVKLEADNVLLPSQKILLTAGLEPLRLLYLGELKSLKCYAGEMQDDISPPEGMAFQDLRRLFGFMEAEFFGFARRALHFVTWGRSSQYCGQCGTPTENKNDEYAKICPKCGLLNFPRISPAVMAAITRGEEILLARGVGFPKSFYSVLAGFVEPGETLEDCLKREVKEEVGLEIKNIAYFGSQPWPFPDSLMIAFTAEYGSKEISIDKNELLDARWFKANELPRIPGKISIARRLIDSFLNKNIS